MERGTYFAELDAAIAPHPDYRWSTDYDLALSLLEGGSLCGLALYGELSDGHKIFDLCRIRRDVPSGYRAGVRGYEFFDAKDADEFKAMCVKYDVRFLVPHEHNVSLAVRTLADIREALEAGPEMGRAKMALFLRAERDECLESCKGLARLVRDNIHLGRELQCVSAMLEDAIQGYHLMGDVLQLVIERDELRELAGRMVSIIAYVNRRIWAKALHEEMNAILADARKLGLGG